MLLLFEPERPLEVWSHEFIKSTVLEQSLGWIRWYR